MWQLIRKYSKTERTHRVAQDSYLLEDSSQRGEKELELNPPQTGYTEAKALLLEMIEKGYEDLDIMVVLNEQFDRQLVDTLLDDCRRKGII